MFCLDSEEITIGYNKILDRKKIQNVIWSLKWVKMLRGMPEEMSYVY